MQRVRLKSLDALRAVAALLVLIFHYEALLYFVPPTDFPRPDTQLFQYGLMGVELFFIISGFVILMTLESASTVRKFIINRAARLYPAYWVSVILTAIYLLSLNEAIFKRAAVNMTMLQTFLGVGNLINIYWSLAYELWFYVVMATIAACGVLNRIAPLVLIWFAFAITLQVLDIHLDGLRGVITFEQYGHLFIAGMMIYLISNGRGTVIVKLALALSVSYSLFGRPDWSHIPYYGYFLVNATFIALVYLASSGRLSVISRPWLTSIGTNSYSLYLLHLTIGFAFTRAATVAGFTPWIGIIPAIPAAFIAAAFSRRYIEVPSQRATRKILDYCLPRRTVGASG